MYCTYKVRKNKFNIKPGYYRVLLWGVTIYSRLGTMRKRLRLPCNLTTGGVPKSEATN